MTSTLTLVIGLLAAAGFVLATALVAAASELRAVYPGKYNLDKELRKTPQAIQLSDRCYWGNQ